jgi:hypothetical protein
MVLFLPVCGQVDEDPGVWHRENAYHQTTPGSQTDQRGMWEAEPQMKEELQDIYLEVEGKLEESQEKSLKKLGV